MDEKGEENMSITNDEMIGKLVFDRYKGKNTSSLGKLFKFRDGVDISGEFNYTNMDKIYDFFRILRDDKNIKEWHL